MHINNKKRLEILLQDMAELQGLVEYFETSPDNIPRLELDLALAKMREIYDSLRKVETKPMQERDEKVSEKKEHAEVIIPEKVVVKESLSATEVVHKAPVQTIERENIAEVQVQKIVADRFSSKKNINEKLAPSKKHDDIASRMQAKPITDLEKALGINDKFVFTKELFAGNRAHFNNAIKELNMMRSYNEALAYIQENYSWDMENVVVQNLLDLLKRKYS